MAEKVLELKYKHFTPLDTMCEEDRALIEAAREVAHRAIAPYSHFSVGAAARLSSGEIVVSANVESDVYPAGICAERNLLFNIAVNHADSPILAVAITSISTDEECYPCGVCRQTILDTERRQGSPIRVIMAGSESATTIDSATLLLPFAFKL